MSTHDTWPGRPARPNRRFPDVTPQFALGLFIMVLGAALLLDQLGLVNSSYLLRFWPVILIAFGAMHFTRGAREHRFWGMFWIFTGSWLLLRTLDIIDAGFWELFVPVLLIAFGLNIVMRTLSESGYVKPDKGRSPHLFAVFSESKQRYDGQRFEGAYMTAVMGSCDLDLRRAIMQPGEERSVVVFALMAGHVIRVPPEWQVIVKVAPIFGGIDDKRVPPVAPPALDPGPPRLVIHGTIFMAGLELKD